MAQDNSEWENWGSNIQELVNQAINSHDYRKLNQSVRQVVGKAVDFGTDTLRRAVSDEPRSVSCTVESNNLPALYGNTGGMTATGIAKIIGGVALAGLSLLALLGFYIISRWFYWDIGILPLLLALIGMVCGAALTVSGVKRLGLMRRFKTYRRILGEKTYCALDQLARGVGKNVSYVRREVRKMIDRGLFLQGHMDNEQTMLIVSDETYQYYEQNRIKTEQQRREAQQAKQAQAKRATADAGVQEVLDRGNAFIVQIRACNNAIPGEEISKKISRMETIVQRIFQRAEQCPEIVPGLKKMMDYYLPMTVKLLNAYADMDTQPVQGNNIQASKREIEQTLDTLNLAFEKLLDEMFSDTAMDISSDISVLHTLLAQEGLAGDDLHRSKIEKS